MNQYIILDILDYADDHEMLSIFMFHNKNLLKKDPYHYQK